MTCQGGFHGESPCSVAGSEWNQPQREHRLDLIIPQYPSPDRLVELQASEISESFDWAGLLERLCGQPAQTQPKPKPVTYAPTSLGLNRSRSNQPRQAGCHTPGHRHTSARELSVERRPAQEELVGLTMAATSQRSWVVSVEISTPPPTGGPTTSTMTTTIVVRYPI